jgi:protein-disulfide isomerase
MHRRIQFVANVALIVLATVILVRVFFPRLLPLDRVVAIAAGGDVRPPRENSVRPPVPVPAEPVSIVGAPLLGHPEAPVILIEYSDFQCPFCAAFVRDTLPILRRDYFDTGKAALAFRHLPLPSLHADAVKAAEAAECAHAQGRFWEMHDVLFQNQKALDDAGLERHATTAGTDLGRFRDCMAAAKSADVAAASQASAGLKVRGTPTFFVGVRAGDGRIRVLDVISGSRPAGTFGAALERAIVEVQNAEGQFAKAR